jgi:DinB family protein
MSTPAPASDFELRYPVGKFQAPKNISADDRARWIDELERLPGQLAASVSGLNERQLDTPYRPGGWSIRQVVHHLPDSHMNSYVRVRLALTEDCPTVKPYAEDRWAELADASRGPVDLSLSLLAALHARWVILLRSLGDPEFARTMHHPEHGDLRLDRLLAMYAWHGRHHLAHIANLRQRSGW